MVLQTSGACKEVAVFGCNVGVTIRLSALGNMLVAALASETLFRVARTSFFQQSRRGKHSCEEMLLYIL